MGKAIAASARDLVSQAKFSADNARPNGAAFAQSILRIQSSQPQGLGTIMWISILPSLDPDTPVEEVCGR